MGMGENDAGGDQFDNQNDVIVAGAPKSPWKTPAAASPVVAADSESWPALSDAQQRAKNNGGVDSNSTKSPPTAEAEVDGCGDASPAVQPATVELQKFHGRGNTKYPRKPYTMHQNKTGPKHAPNGVPPFAVPRPYYPPTPVFHTMVPMSPISAPGYGYQFPPGALPREGASAKGITKEYSCPTSSTACPKRRKRKTKQKTKYSDTEVSVPQHIRLRGRVRRRDNNNTITDERGELDSATFLHYFMHIWNAFPEEKVKFVTYFDPLWFDLYAGENNRARVLNWIKEKAIFSKKYVLVPIVMWSHWSLLILCHLGESLHSETNTRCMLLLDSLHAIGPTRLEPLIRRLLFDVHKSEERVVSRQELQKIPLLIPKVPQQKKGEECGFYVLYYIRLFLENAPENFSISKGYPYFMKKDWFSVESVESFCKSLDAFRPLILSDDDEDDGGDSVVFIGTER